ncbi:DUF7537 family lipoprotein [Halosimplex sp. J119]
MTTRRRWATVAVAFLLVLAGCNVLSSSGGESITETVTPVPVPSAVDSGTQTETAATTTGIGVGAFPGISARRGIDVDRLLSAHVVSLATQSYTVEWERWAGGGAGPVADRFQRRVEIADDGTYLRRERGVRDGNVTSMYVGPEGAYHRTVSDEETAVTSVSIRDEDSANERFAKLVTYEVRAFLSEGYDTLDVVERGDRRYARVFVTRPPPELAAVYDAYALRNFSATVWIAPEGYVRALHYEFDLVGAQSGFAVEWRYAYFAVGETTVERPPWVPTNGTVTPRNGTAGSTDIERSPLQSTATPTADPSRVPVPDAGNATDAD